MADPAVHVVIVGGVSVNDPEGHDAYPYNFINPGAKRAIAFGANAHVLMFTPAYERRVLYQTKEHSSVTIPMVDQCLVMMAFEEVVDGKTRLPYTEVCVEKAKDKVKDKQHFWKVMKTSSGKNGFALDEIRTAQDLTDMLKGFPRIESIDYFGHSNKEEFFLQYSTTMVVGGQGSGTGEVTWSKTEAAAIDRKKFTAAATFATFGCNQGETGGLADDVRNLWKIRAIGSEGKTNYQPIGQNKPFPTSNGGYYEYPTPTLPDPARDVWVQPPRKPAAKF